MSEAEKMFASRATLLREMEQLGEMQRDQEISSEEYSEEFQKRNTLYVKLMQESKELGHFDNDLG